MPRPRLLLATDLPFWRGSTGAEQRILSLTEFLQDQPLELRTFSLLPPDQRTPGDPDRIRELGLDVELHDSNQPPRRWWSRVGWYGSAIAHQLRPRTTGTASTATLDSFRWPWAITAMRETIADFRPDFLLIEYVKLAYLLDGLPRFARCHLTTILDSHDLLHRRHQQFADRGHPHWIAITADEEAQVARRFDVILAIQNDEADWFRTAAPRSRVICCPHALRGNDSPQPSVPADRTTSRSRQASIANRTAPPRPLRIGYLGSDNWPNRSALQWLLETLQPAVENELPDPVQWILAGAVTEGLPGNPNPQIEVLGRIDSLTEFYSRVDLIINPVEFGSGLKIKNVEALGFGKPLITTQAGAQGLPSAVSAPDSPIIVADSVADVVAAVGRWQHAETRSRASRAARNLAQSEYAAPVAYAALAEVLLGESQMDADDST